MHLLDMKKLIGKRDLRSGDYLAYWNGAAWIPVRYQEVKKFRGVQSYIITPSGRKSLINQHEASRLVSIEAGLRPSSFAKKLMH